MWLDILIKNMLPSASKSFAKFPLCVGDLRCIGSSLLGIVLNLILFAGVISINSSSENDWIASDALFLWCRFVFEFDCWMGYKKKNYNKILLCINQDNKTHMA